MKTRQRKKKSKTIKFHRVFVQIAENDKQEVLAGDSTYSEIGAFLNELRAAKISYVVVVGRIPVRVVNRYDGS